MLIREARGMGINRIIVTHPTQGIDMSIEQQKEAAQMGAFLEYCYVGTLPFSGANQKTMAFYAQNMKAIGPAHVIMSTDPGNAVNPLHAAGMKLYSGPSQRRHDARRNRYHGAEEPGLLLGLK